MAKVGQIAIIISIRTLYWFLDLGSLPHYRRRNTRDFDVNLGFGLFLVLFQNTSILVRSEQKFEGLILICYALTWCNFGISVGGKGSETD